MDHDTTSEHWQCSILPLNYIRMAAPFLNIGHGSHTQLTPSFRGDISLLRFHMLGYNFFHGVIV